MSGRLPCCIQPCGRTTKAGVYREWVCPNHWKWVSKAKKRVWARVQRETKRNPSQENVARYDRVWLAMKQAARMGLLG